jgi:hypothetical protein
MFINLQLEVVMTASQNGYKDNNALKKDIEKMITILTRL